MTNLSSILAWKIPWTEEPGGLQFMESQSQTWLSNWAHTCITHMLYVVYLEVCICICLSLENILLFISRIVTVFRSIEFTMNVFVLKDFLNSYISKFSRNDLYTCVNFSFKRPFKRRRTQKSIQYQVLMFFKWVHGDFCLKNQGNIFPFWEYLFWKCNSRFNFIPEGRSPGTSVLSFSSMSVVPICLISMHFV